MDGVHRVTNVDVDLQTERCAGEGGRVTVHVGEGEEVGRDVQERLLRRRRESYAQRFAQRVQRMVGRKKTHRDGNAEVV